MSQDDFQSAPTPVPFGYANPDVVLLRKRSRAWQNWLGLAGWALVATFFMGLLTIVTPRAFVGYAFVFQVFLIAAWLQAVQAARRRRALDVLGYIEQAVKLNIPIPTALWAAEQSEQGVIVRRLSRLRVLVAAGQPLGYSLVQSVPEMSLETAGQIGVAERLGQLPRVLHWLRRSRRRGQPWAPEEAAFNISYLPAMLLVVTGITQIIAIFVIPKYQQIFRDFKTPLPWATTLFLEIVRSQWLSMLVSAYVLIWIGQLIARIFRTGDRFFGQFIDFFSWYIPVLNWRVRDRGLSGLCQAVGAAALAGWPLTIALREVGDLQTNAVLRRRILRWAQGVEAGMAIPEAARHAKMPALMVGMLAPARSAEDMGQVMSFLARHYETRFERAEIFFEAVYIPVVVLAMGVIVGFVALSLLMPLVTLVDTISTHMPGPVR